MFILNSFEWVSDSLGSGKLADDISNDSEECGLLFTVAWKSIFGIVGSIIKDLHH